jgi:hypothetical protein
MPPGHPANWVPVCLPDAFSPSGLADLLTCAGVVLHASGPDWVSQCAVAAGVRVVDAGAELYLPGDVSMKRREVVFVGDDPGPRGDPDLPLFHLPRTRSGGRFLDLLGWDDYEGMTTPRMNASYLHRGPKRGPVSDDVGRWLSPLLASSSEADRLVMLLGGSPAAAFGAGAVELEYFLPARGRVGRSSVLLVKVPHPSVKNQHLTMEVQCRMRVFGAVVRAWRSGPKPTPEGTETDLVVQDLARLDVARLGGFTDVGLPRLIGEGQVAVKCRR